MLAFFCLEASQEEGCRKYRLAFGCGLHPTWASVIFAAFRLF